MCEREGGKDVLTIYKHCQREEGEDHDWLEVEHCVNWIRETCRRERGREGGREGGRERGREGRGEEREGGREGGRERGREGGREGGRES